MTPRENVKEKKSTKKWKKKKCYWFNWCDKL